MGSPRAPVSRALRVAWGACHPVSPGLLPAVASRAERGLPVELVRRGHGSGPGPRARLLEYLSRPPQHGKQWPGRRHLSSFSEGDNRLGFAEGHGLHGGPHGDVSCRSSCSRDDRADAAGAAMSDLARRPAHHCLHHHQGEWPSLPPAALQGCCGMAEVLLCASLFMSACPSINLWVVRLPAKGLRSPLAPCSSQERGCGVFLGHGNKWGICSRNASICQRPGRAGAHRASPADTGSTCVRAVRLAHISAMPPRSPCSGKARSSALPWPLLGLSGESGSWKET